MKKLMIGGKRCKTFLQHQSSCPASFLEKYHPSESKDIHPKFQIILFSVEFNF
jgi:hypothetical protein